MHWDDTALKPGSISIRSFERAVAIRLPRHSKTQAPGVRCAIGSSAATIKSCWNNHLAFAILLQDVSSLH